VGIRSPLRSFGSGYDFATFAFFRGKTSFLREIIARFGSGPAADGKFLLRPATRACKLQRFQFILPSIGLAH
jgi:hypothetical protein